MKIGRLVVASCAAVVVSLPVAAGARPVVEGVGRVARKMHAPADVAPVERDRAPERGFVWPVVGAINTPFGGDHAGIDIEGETGDAIVAAKSGTITFAGDEGDGYGVKVVIRHASGYETLYSHLSSIVVESGEIDQGDLVGYVGCTGSCTGDHLHFEIHRGGTPVDPVPLLP